MRGAILALALLWLAPRDSSAQSTPQVSLLGGFGLSVRVNRGRTQERMFVLQPQASWRLGKRFDAIVEGHFAKYFQPDGWGAGLVPLSARYYFATAGSRPYFNFGAGFCWTNLEIEELDRRFNFILQAGFGIKTDLSARRSWLLEARWYHYSNAGTVRPNLGFNGVVLLGGWRFF
ncbi:MAG TPA: acyloxyacyl hydrolase [Thermoanaerobaculia bacterium]|jgi:hypothetical protein